MQTTKILLENGWELTPFQAHWELVHPSTPSNKYRLPIIVAIKPERPASLVTYQINPGDTVLHFMLDCPAHAWTGSQPGRLGPDGHWLIGSVARCQWCGLSKERWQERQARPAAPEGADHHGQ